MRELTEQNAIDIVYGCAVVGTGGGGNLKSGLEMIRKLYSEGGKIEMADLSELPDDAFVATPYGCGAPKLLGKKLDDKYARLPQLDYPAPLLAFRSLEEYMDKSFFAVASSELGAESTAEALFIAGSLGLPIMNADAAGRSVPDLQYSTYFVKKKPIYPMAVATEFGETIIIKNVVDDFRAEAIARSIAVASNNMVGIADHPMSGKDYKSAVIPEAMDYAMRIGEILRKVKNSGGSGYDVANHIASEMDGKIAFHGVIKEAPWEARDGYNYGEIHLTGQDDFGGDEYVIHFKNENIISYHNGNVDVTSPDLICMINAEGIPVNTPNFEVGEELNVLALTSPGIWTTEEGLKCFDLNYFGFDVPYKPFVK
ncbi:DUF917 domain-containing protein [Aminicella lysinilytica]|uniref:DUF917 domain-containing protein n=1 Tax=Aminicella lysinilytica TaxID=433323 RepID=UPI0026E92FDB|nr:DUF917 domain-containing protein [Aminicella lysinilytica]